MVSEFYGVEERAIKRYVQECGDDLRANGYFLSEGNSLKELKLHFVGDINIPNFTRQLRMTKIVSRQQQREHR